MVGLQTVCCIVGIGGAGGWGFPHSLVASALAISEPCLERIGLNSLEECRYFKLLYHETQFSSCYSQNFAGT